MALQPKEEEIVMSYNKKSAAKYGWEPEWFGAEDFGSVLQSKIKDFQLEYGLDADGLCGPSTYRRLASVRELELDEDVPPSPEGKDYIFVNGDKFPIAWDKVVTWNEPGGMQAPSNTYRKHIGKRDVKFFVNHWDVCLSASSCFKVLKKRGISVHFCIDNDGTIYQTMDANDVGWHAGGRNFNNWSIGVEISNAYYTKYQGWYTKRFGPRPVVKGAKVHGSTLEDHLDFYPVQIQAAKALWEACAAAYNIPLRTPINEDGSEYGTVYTPAVFGHWRGVLHHYNLVRKKIDCGGLDLTKYME